MNILGIENELIIKSIIFDKKIGVGYNIAYAMVDTRVLKQIIEYHKCEILYVLFVPKKYFKMPSNLEEVVEKPPENINDVKETWLKNRNSFSENVLLDYFGEYKNPIIV